MILNLAKLFDPKDRLEILCAKGIVLGQYPHTR